MHSTGDSFAQVRRHGNARRVAIVIYMPEKLILDKWAPDFDVRLKSEIEFNFVVVEFCLCDDVMSDTRDYGVGAQIVELVRTKFDAVYVVDWVNVRQHFARQVSRNHLVDNVASEFWKNVCNGFRKAFEVLDFDRVLH